MYSKIKIIEKREKLNNGILSYNSFYTTQHVSGFFSLASIKKPSCVLINCLWTREILLTKTQNGTQR
jgi:hypothetical protein